jgi:zinc transport system permease protein
VNTLDQAIALLAYGFVQRAFVIGALVALLASLLSVFVVLRSMALIGDGLAHTAFGGLAVGYFFGLSPIWTAAVLVIFGSMGITKVTRSTKIPSDAAVAVFLTLGLATGILLLTLGHGFGISLESLLFGSILLSNLYQIYFAAAVLVATVGLIVLSYPRLVYTTFHEGQAQAAGVRTWVFDYLLAVLVGIAVVVAIPIAGILLIAALLVLPGLTAIQVAGSFQQTMILSAVFGLTSVVGGIFLSLWLDVAPGATIVLTGLLLLVVVMSGKKILGLKVWRARASVPGASQSPVTVTSPAVGTSSNALPAHGSPDPPPADPGAAAAGQ